jgi:hypothetical protein
VQRIPAYTTAKALSIQELDARGNALIQEGFQLFGSPYVSGTGESMACQPMVKYVETLE